MLRIPYCVLLLDSAGILRLPGPAPPTVRIAVDLCFVLICVPIVSISVLR